MDQLSTLVIDKKTFGIVKMPPREQQHVLRRIAPLMAPVAPAALALLDEKADKAEVFTQVAAALGPFADVLARMEDDAFDYVMDACLVRVQYLDPTDEKFHPAYTSAGGRLLPMYGELIDSGTELRLVAEVIKVNLRGFFGRLSEGTALSLGATPPAAAAGASSN